MGALTEHVQRGTAHCGGNIFLCLLCFRWRELWPVAPEYSDQAIRSSSLACGTGTPASRRSGLGLEAAEKWVTSLKRRYPKELCADIYRVSSSEKIRHVGPGVPEGIALTSILYEEVT